MIVERPAEGGSEYQLGEEGRRQRSTRKTGVSLIAICAHLGTSPHFIRSSSYVSLSFLVLLTTGIWVVGATCRGKVPSVNSSGTRSGAYTHVVARPESALRLERAPVKRVLVSRLPHLIARSASLPVLRRSASLFLLVCLVSILLLLAILVSRPLVVCRWLEVIPGDRLLQLPSTQPERKAAAHGGSERSSKQSACSASESERCERGRGVESWLRAGFPLPIASLAYFLAVLACRHLETASLRLRIVLACPSSFPPTPSSSR